MRKHTGQPQISAAKKPLIKQPFMHTNLFINSPEDFGGLPPSHVLRAPSH